MEIFFACGAKYLARATKLLTENNVFSDFVGTRVTWVFYSEFFLRAILFVRSQHFETALVLDTSH